MSKHTAKVFWQRGNNEDFIDNKYSRVHQWDFEGGASIPASPSSQVVPLPYSVEEYVDPEQAFVASLSSCHMLFFLAIAAKRRFIVDRYLDHAVGTLAQDNEGKISMTQVILRPEISFFGEKQPTYSQLESLHHQAHQQCFIANSVKTAVITEVVVNES